MRPSRENLKEIQDILKSALTNIGHIGTFSNSKYQADELLEAIGNLLSCSEENVSNFLAIDLLSILASILDGPLFEQPLEEQFEKVDITNRMLGPQINQNEFSLVEKRLAAKCCWTLCFNSKARVAIASNIMFYRGTNFYNKCIKTRNRYEIK